MKLFTIGFSKKSAQEFFERLRQPGLVRVVDTRLNNTSQLAGFTKRGDLPYLLKRIGDLDYVHLPITAPTPALLAAYRHAGDWIAYSQAFNELLHARRVATLLDPAVFDGACLLCSEAAPHHCHRRLVAEHLRDAWGSIDIEHL